VRRQCVASASLLQLLDQRAERRAGRELCCQLGLAGVRQRHNVQCCNDTHRVTVDTERPEDGTGSIALEVHLQL